MRAPRSVRKQTIASQHGGEGCSGQEQTKRTVNTPSSVRTVTPPVASGFDLRQPTLSDPTSDCQWQREEDLQQRRRIISEIYQVLISNTRDRRVRRMAKLLEVSLYRSAPSLEAYCDFRTLKRRLRRLAQNLRQPTLSDPTSDCQWQREEDLQQRRRIISEIYQLLISDTRDWTKEHPDYFRELLGMAKVLEVSLYRSAPSLEAYRDVRTLERRLRRLAQNLESTRTDSREEGKRMITRNPQEG